jgi:Ca2+-binding RTX toxin-like protein
VLNGNGGADTADYFNATAGITVDLANAGNNTGEAIGDTYASIENLRGTALNDTLRGDGNTNLLDGQVGADVLDGSGGNDYAWYNTATTGVVANLANTAANTGDAAGDSYISIEGLFGSAFNDVLTGDADANFLRGGAGADTLEGGAGIDTFIFASVADSPGGGPSDTITDFAEGEDLFDLSIIDANTAVGGNDTFTFGGQNSNVLVNSITWFQDGTNTIVQADTNGDAVADLTVTLSGLKTLAESDFLL